MSSTAERLLSTLKAVAPASDVSIGAQGVVASVRVSYASTPTAPQLTAVTSALNAFDWSDTAQATWELAQNTDKKTLLDNATQAVTDIDTYLAIASPSAVQQTAQIKKLSQYTRQLIKRLIQIN